VTQPHGEGQEAAAARYLAEIARRLPGALSVSRRVEEGDPAERIAVVAGTDALVVMAMHGRIGLARWALGSVADRVAHSGVAGVLLLGPGRPADRAERLGSGGAGRDGGAGDRGLALTH
jgi:nucleotide-binding universal stress UspA family protein